MGKQYLVPINSPEEREDGSMGSQTCDIVTLEGTKKQRRRQWYDYLRIRLQTQDIHKMNKVTRALGPGFAAIIKK